MPLEIQSILIIQERLGVVVQALRVVILRMMVVTLETVVQVRTVMRSASLVF
jgi:hypothetical protein